MDVQSGMSYDNKKNTFYHIGQVSPPKWQMYDVADQGNLLRQLKTDSMQDLMSYRPGKKAVWGVGTR